MKNSNLRTVIRNIIQENFSINEKQEELDEERITNSDGKDYVKKKENFVGSHVFGELVGDSYVAVSYGEQFPIYIFYNGEWYENSDDYVYNGEVQSHTEQHKKDLRPTFDTHLKSKNQMIKLLDKIKEENNISSLNHTSVEPGEKN